MFSALDAFSLGVVALTVGDPLRELLAGSAGGTQEVALGAGVALVLVRVVGDTVINGVAASGDAGGFRGVLGLGTLGAARH